MPSRDPDRSGPTKPRITRHHTEAVVVTRGVSRGLVRLQLLPRCCPPNDHEHAPPPGQGGGGLCRESESGVFLTMGRIAAAPAWRDRSKSHDREPARIHVCIPVAAASGGLSDLRWCYRSGCCRRPVGHHLSCSFTSPSPEPGRRPGSRPRPGPTGSCRPLGLALTAPRFGGDEGEPQPRTPEAVEVAQCHQGGRDHHQHRGDGAGPGPHRTPLDP
jgi:hypothetical protein